MQNVQGVLINCQVELKDARQLAPRTGTGIHPTQDMNQNSCEKFHPTQDKSM